MPFHIILPASPQAQASQEAQLGDNPTADLPTGADLNETGSNAEAEEAESASTGYVTDDANTEAASLTLDMPDSKVTAKKKKATVIYFNCDEPGHIIRYCPKPIKKMPTVPRQLQR